MAATKYIVIQKNEGTTHPVLDQNDDLWFATTRQLAEAEAEARRRKAAAFYDSAEDVPKFEVKAVPVTSLETEKFAAKLVSELLSFAWPSWASEHAQVQAAKDWLADRGISSP